MDNEDKKIHIALALVAVLLLSGFVWFWCAGRNDVSDLRRGAQPVTEQLDRAESRQREQAGSLDRAAEAASDSQRAAGEIQSIERRDADLISGSQSIIDRVRERGTAQDTGED